MQHLNTLSSEWGFRTTGCYLVGKGRRLVSVADDWLWAID